MPAVDPTQFDVRSAELMRTYGQGLIRPGSKYERVFRVPWGSDVLDWATFGGAPIGRKVRIYGDESTGKTIAMWHLLRNAQNYHIIMDERYLRLIEVAKDIGDKETVKRLNHERDVILERFPNGMEAVYYNVEQNFTPDFVEAKGVDIDRLRVVDTTTIETIGATCEALMGAAHIHIIDSTSAATSIRKLEAEAEDELPMLEAKRWTDMFDRISARFSPDENMLLYISHTYESGYGRQKTEIPKGGRRMKYASDLTLHLRKGGWLFYDKDGMLTEKGQSTNTISGMKEPDGVEVVGRVNKARVNPPFRTFRYRLGFREPRYDNGFELKQAAEFYGLVRKSGSFFYWLDEEGKDASPSMHGEAKLREFIMANPEVREKCRTALLEGEESTAGDLEGSDLDGDE